jgi:hypothetical protein
MVAKVLGVPPAMWQEVIARYPSDSTMRSAQEADLAEDAAMGATYLA